VVSPDRFFLPFWYRLTRVVPDKGPLNGCVCVCGIVYVQLTHAVLNKELKHCGHLEDLEVNENVKGKARAYVVKYMSKFPGAYRPSNLSP